MESFYNCIYKNILLFAKKYRKYEMLDSELSYNDFKDNIQVLGYIINKFHDNKEDTEVNIILFDTNAKQLKSSSDFIKILNKFKKKTTLIIITKIKLTIHILKKFKVYPDLTIHNYLHKNFIMELPKGPLCSKHELMSREEINLRCKDMKAHGHKFQAIRVDDPQNIWIGGKVNDLIKTTSISETTGRYINYRIVIPSTGRVNEINEQNEDEGDYKSDD